MKRDFLEAFGLKKADIDAILAENGKNLDELRQKCHMLEEENAGWKTTKEAADKQRQETEAELARLRQLSSDADSFRCRIVDTLVAGAHPASAAAACEIKRKLAEESADGGDPFAALDRMKAEDPNAFQKEIEPERPIFASFSKNGDPLAGTMPPIPIR